MLINWLPPQMQHDDIQVVIFQYQTTYKCSPIKLQCIKNNILKCLINHSAQTQISPTTFFEFHTVRNLDSIKVTLQIFPSGMFAVLK